MTRYSGKVTGASGKGFSADIRVEGLEQTIAALRALEPEALKRMNKTIRASLTKVKSAASASGPPGHRMSYRIRASSRGKRTGMSLRAADKETSIFEFAGTKGRSRSGGPITPQGAAMVKWLDGFGKPGRFMWDAWDKHKSVFERDLKAAIGEAEHAVQAKLDAAGERY